MKRFFFVLLLLCCGLLSFAAEQSDQYCYIFNQDSQIEERDAPVIHSVKKNDWFLSDKLYNPEKDSYATIDGKTYKALGAYHLMTEEEYESVLSGKKNEPETPERDCRNCYFHGAWDCRHPKSYGVCERYVPIHE